MMQQQTKKKENLREIIETKTKQNFFFCSIEEILITR